MRPTHIGFVASEIVTHICRRGNSRAVRRRRFHVSQTEGWAALMAVATLVYSFNAWPQPYSSAPFAGASQIKGSTDGTGRDARFFEPVGVAVGPEADIYVADMGNQTIRHVTHSGG